MSALCFCRWPSLSTLSSLNPSNQPLMWLTPDRVFYHGLLGAPTLRSMGAVMVYVAVSGQLRIQLDGGDWQHGTLAVVPPYLPHQVAAEDRRVHVLQIEAETVDLAALPEVLQVRGTVHAPAWVERVRMVQAQLSAQGLPSDSGGMDFDQLLLGQSLPARVLDTRIAKVLAAIKKDPAAPAVAQDYADLAHLSFSRFLHVFKQEVGAPFRSFRSWKRARNLLHHVVRQDANLLDVALDAGYPDSTYFSHSIRQIYGLKPSDIFAGSRRLVVYAPALA